MDIRIPIRLEYDSIVESIFEIRFSSSVALPSELLPGMLYQKLRSQFPTLVNLPIKDMPTQVRQSDPSLIYQPVVSLEGKNCKINIGDKTISLAVVKPYIGWARKKELLKLLVESLEETALIDKIERYSTKYVNIVPNPTEDYSIFSALKIDLDLGGFQLSHKGVNIKAEIEMDNTISIVNVSPYAMYKKGNEIFEGALIDVDTICLDVENHNDLKSVLSGADKIHNIEKRIFFGLLKKQTIESMKPIWS